MQNILLAAGLATRSDGQKLLYPFGGETVVHRATAQSLEAGLFTILVTGYRAEEIVEAVEDLRCPGLLIVHNPDYSLGQGVSTQRGALALRSTTPFFISLADMPLIEARHYHHLASMATGELLRPRYRGTAGHPVLLGPSFIPIIQNRNGPFAMRDVLNDYPTQWLEVEEEAYVTDIDTPSSYQSLIADQPSP